MVKNNIKIQIRLIIILCIFLSIPYKGYINKKVYDPEANYQVLKKINRSSIETYDNIMIVYDKNEKVDFYNFKSTPIIIRNLDKIIYLENFEPDFETYDDAYFCYVIMNKDNITYYYRREIVEEINEKDYKSFVEKNIYFEKDKKVNPSLPYFQTPKEFFNNFKEYFIPYYLAEYEVK
ncbi:hypothetical protein HP397_06605 [Streptobacillus felis]|uniref:DUF3997 domain-containing protein n=1 Tax=Streptobacillus felis TaxID=1384509 RepID=A0A7Z0PFS5_9FUSO|nr:hypothetical protein [Streptobacillus felis]NYV28468.1 hypothetical protein [Streptobacillus felis]